MLDGAFASALEIAQYRYYWLPLTWLIFDPSGPTTRRPGLAARCFRSIARRTPSPRGTLLNGCTHACLAPVRS